MFRQVYFHRSLRSAEVVLRSVLRRALELFQAGQAVWFAHGTPFEKILRGEKLSLGEHMEMDDSDLMFHIKQWQREPDAILSDLSQRFIHRRLFKAFDMDMPNEERQDFLEKARLAVENAGFDPSYYFVEDKISDMPYYFYTKDASDPKNLIYVQEGYARSNMREISEISAAVRSLQKGYIIHRVCFPHELTEEISRLYHGYNESAADAHG